MALLSRTVEPAANLPATQPTRNSPLYELAREAYQSRQIEIGGEIPAGAAPQDQERWSGVLLRER
jgi:hypothetical protein